MYLKYLFILGVLFFISCGGGGGSSPVSNNIQQSAAGSNTGQITDQLQIVE